MSDTAKNPLTPRQRADYAEKRTKGWPAAGAFFYAKRNEGGPDVPTENAETFERDGFTLTVERGWDEGAHYQWVVMGSWERDESTGTVDRAKAGYFVGEGQVGFFLPNITEQEHIDGGASDQEARRYVLEDLERAEAYERDEWQAEYLRVVVRREDVELGSASLYGVASDEGDCYRRGLIDDLATEALKEAETVLERLCGCTK